LVDDGSLGDKNEKIKLLEEHSQLVHSNILKAMQTESESVKSQLDGVEVSRGEHGG
jgi:hypothetical protein